jgi:6,7-dimethyl-8-ribityllumazine synthase
MEVFMPRNIQGILIASDKKFGIICSRFNEFITRKLLDGAVDCLCRHKAEDKDIDIYWVPGSFEIPALAAKLAKSGEYDAIICIGAVIRGDTPHFDFIAAEVSKGIAHAGLQGNIPVIYGVITTDTIEQAIERAGTKAGNKGWDAALSAIEMANIYEQISGT